MRLHRGLATAGALALGLALVALVGFASVSNKNTDSQEVELLHTLQDEERADPHFASCVNHLKGEGMELVMRVDSTCGDVFTASECNIQCHTAAEALADALGCCWPRLIAGFSKVQPSAAHAWHSWAFNLENLCGVSIAGRCDKQTYSAEKSVADSALGVAQRALAQAQREERAANAARRAALDAQAQAKKLQQEMAREEEEFQKMRHHFRLSRADASRAVLVERMVHNSVKKDLQKAWGLHKQVTHDSKLASKLAAGTQVQQANARQLLKSAHAAKKSVYAMAKLAQHAKKAAFRLHKLALKDLVRAKRVEKRARLQRAIAKKAGKDVAKQLHMSEKIIAKSRKEQKKAKKLWGALEDEQKGFSEEHKEAEEGVDDEEAIDKKMQAEIAEAEEKFEAFGKEAEGVESAVTHAEDLAEHAATISAESENLLTQTKQQQDEIDRQRGWLMQQEAQVYAGRKGVAALEGQLDVLKKKFYNLRRAIGSLTYATRRVPAYLPHSAPPPPRPLAHAPGYYYHYHRETLVQPGQPLNQVVVPFPPRVPPPHFVFRSGEEAPQQLMQE